MTGGRQARHAPAQCAAEGAVQLGAEQNQLFSKAGEHLYGVFGDARVGLIDVRDIAAAGAAILRNPERHEGTIYTPTGPESITLGQAAEDITRTLGQPVTYVPQSPEQTRDGLLQAGLDEWSAEVLAEYRVAYGSGWGDFTNDHVARIVGRQPRTFAEFVHDHREHLTNA
ncbi:hypothetical protein AB0B85_00595 [Micromonospora sp. NPDC049044]|uniref:hypothetical protein n=1 Tax=Micromonospora sp. NPDC049044 TaxID=3154827 RepID=UPI0033C04C27